MAKSKPPLPPEVNESNILSYSNKGQSSKPNKCRGKNPRNKPSPELKAEPDFQGRLTDLEGYIFDLGPRASDKFVPKMKELKRYLRATYSGRFQPSLTHICLTSLIQELSAQNRCRDELPQEKEHQ